MRARVYATPLGAEIAAGEAAHDTPNHLQTENENPQFHFLNLTDAHLDRSCHWTKCMNPNRFAGCRWGNTLLVTRPVSTLQCLDIHPPYILPGMLVPNRKS